MVTRRRCLAGLGAAGVALAGCGNDGVEGNGERTTPPEDGGTVPERFVHWLLWNVPADVGSVPKGVPQERSVLDGARQGTNDFDETGYRGPLPPEGDGPHTYRFTMYTVAAELDLEAGSRRDDLEAALDGRVPDTHRITGEFER